MKKMAKRILTAALALGLALAVLPTASYAASAQEDAVKYLVEIGVYQGNENGDLMLDKSLTRAELAVILTRLDFITGPAGLGRWNEWGIAHFTDPNDRDNKFVDLPDWVLPYVEYCYEGGLIKGVTATEFNPQGKVNAQMVCTILLRWLNMPETDWNYDTSVTKAQALSLTTGANTGGATITRGDTAVIVHQGMNYKNRVTPQPLPNETTPGKTPETTAPAMTIDTIDEMKAEVVRLTNEERAKAGLPVLEALPELMDCAQAKAQDFLDNHYFDHESPRYGALREMIKTFVPKAKSGSENIALVATNIYESFEAGVSSPEHYANMVSAKYTYIGVGIVEGVDGVYWLVQQFVSL
jgi:uncharacterized protein YkwD